ncbi:MAG: T9SS type A sorting domain-containing protein [Bacteroidota bacterium]
MKKLYAFISALFISHLLVAQVFIDCNSNRYDEEIFSTIDTTNDIVYGANTDYQGTNTILSMDIYQPTGDTAAFRPLIVWVHGGSFVGGSKIDNDVVGLCQHFAKRGYVCASITYRLGITFPYNQANATNSVFRGVQDMKAAIRYFRKDAATTNLYRIDPEMIFGGGSSAGAFCALHLAYLDQPSELPATVDTVALGGMEGNSGNPGYASTVNAVLNLCGALGDTAWMVAGDVPVCSMHGTADAVVPYSTAILYLLQVFPIMIVNGSYSVNEHAMLTGIDQTMYTFYGADHVPYASNVNYMDTTVHFVSNFLYRFLGCTPRDPNPVANTWNSVSVNEISTISNSMEIYPNPASTEFTIKLPESALGATLRMIDVTGKEIFSTTIQTPVLKIQNRDRSGGVYILKVISGKEVMTKLLVVE